MARNMWRSQFPGRMKGSNPTGQVPNLHARESRFPDHLRERILWRKTTNALGEIAICGFVARHHLAEPRQNREGIGFVESIQSGSLDAAELETEETPAGL